MKDPLLPGPFERWTQRLVARFVGKAWYNTMLHGQRPEGGATVFVGLHRNGAIDGYVHLCALGGDIVFLVAAGLRRNPLTRLLAVGIPVERAKDKQDRSGNPAALEAAARWVAGGGQLFVYPEGTSTLGPDVLPFQPGAARIIALTLELGVVPRLVAVGIDYARPEIPGSIADVLIGKAIVLDGLPEQREDRVTEIQARITSALRALVYRFTDDVAQSAARYAAEIEAAGDRPRRLELLRRPPPAALPARPPGSPLASVVLGLGILANPLPALTIAFAPKLLADDRNVVAFWQIVPTVLTAPLWLTLCGIAALIAFGPAGLLVPVVQAVFGLAALRAAARAFPPRKPPTKPELEPPSSA